MKTKTTENKIGFGNPNANTRQGKCKKFYCTVPQQYNISKRNSKDFTTLGFSLLQTSLSLSLAVRDCNCIEYVGPNSSQILKTKKTFARARTRERQRTVFGVLCPTRSSPSLNFFLSQHLLSLRFFISIMLQMFFATFL